MEREIPRLRFSSSCLRICLVLNSIVLWFQGASFLLMGVFKRNLLKYLFVDGSGLKEAGGFPVASIILGIVMVSVSFVINFILVFPTKLRYFGLSFLLMILFSFEIIFFIVGFQYAQTIGKVLQNGYHIAMINYADGFVTNLEVNLLQWMLQCCGAEDFKDWYKTSWAYGRKQVPESCCIDVAQCHNLEPVMVDDIHEWGCNIKIQSAIRSQNIILITAVIFASITQILGIILSFTLGVRKLQRANTASEVPML